MFGKVPLPFTETSLVATMVRHVEIKAISLQIYNLAQKISCTAYIYSQLSVSTA
jgi:hypothetical protein